MGEEGGIRVACIFEAILLEIVGYSLLQHSWSQMVLENHPWAFY